MTPDVQAIQRLPSSTPFERLGARADLALTGALLVYGIVEALVLDAGAGLLGRMAAAIAMVTPLLWRRSHPLVVLPAVVVVMAAGTLLGAVATDSLLPLPVFVIAFFSAGAYAKTAVTAAAVSGGCLLVVWGGLALADPSDSVSAYLGVGFMAAVSFVLGRVVHRRTAESDRLSRLSAQLEREREARARQAVADERARLARELHDIVAHAISLIAVQAGAARATLGSDPQGAAASMESVEVAARDALGEMRRLLGMLRGEGRPNGLMPQPGIADVDDLVRQATAAGHSVELRMQGKRRPISPGVDLSAYRIVQEGLTNARKHGSGPAVVELNYREHELVIRVMNPVSGQASQGEGLGHGLIGVGERVRLYGGRFFAAVRPNDTYELSVTLPIDAA